MSYFPRVRQDLWLPRLLLAAFELQTTRAGHKGALPRPFYYTVLYWVWGSLNLKISTAMNLKKKINNNNNSCAVKDRVKEGDDVVVVNEHRQLLQPVLQLIWFSLLDRFPAASHRFSLSLASAQWFFLSVLRWEEHTTCSSHARVLKSISSYDIEKVATRKLWHHLHHLLWRQ